MKVTLSRDAMRDRRQILAWYGAESPAARAAFMKRLREALAFLADYPAGAPLLDDELRAKRVLGFPVSILYTIERNRVLVASIFDERRDPAERLS